MSTGAHRPAPGPGRETGGVPYRGSGRPGEPVDRRPGAAARIPAARRAEPLALRRQAWAWLAGWELVRRLPGPVAFGLADLGGRAWYRASAGTRATLERNFRRVLGRAASPEEVARTARDACRSYARYWVEAFRAADLGADDLDARTTTAGFEHLDRALAQDRGVIVLLAHHGSWDIAARWAETHGYHLAVVAEVVRPRRLFERFVALREAMGLEVVPLRREWARSAPVPPAPAPDQPGQGSLRSAQPILPGRVGAAALGAAPAAGSVFGRLEEVLDANHLVGLLSDRDLSGSAPVALLFGEPAGVPRGPAVLAARSGAPIVPISMLQRPGRRWHLRVLPAVDVAGLGVEAASARVATAIEDIVRLDPAQWHCFSPVWHADRPPRPAATHPLPPSAEKRASGWLGRRTRAESARERASGWLRRSEPPETARERRFRWATRRRTPGVGSGTKVSVSEGAPSPRNGTTDADRAVTPPADGATPPR